MKSILFPEMLKASLRNLAIVVGGIFAVFCLTMILDVMTRFFGGSGTPLTNAIFESMLSVFVEYPSRTAALLFVGVTFPSIWQVK